MKRYEDSIGKINGVGKLISLKNGKTGIFKCMICKKDYEGNLHSWYYDGKKICTHKNTSHKLYGRYYRMLERCYNKNAHNYKYYGARGIEVCDRWRESFDNFLEDMESSYREGLELDRIDNDKNYSPSNCRWATHSENMLNRKGFDNETGYPGVRKVNSGYMGRFQKNKTNYKTKIYKTPKEAYEELQNLKKSL